MPDPFSASTAIGLFQGVLALGGLALVGAWFFAPKLEAERLRPPRLPQWDASVLDTLLLCWIAVVSVFLGSALAGSLFRQFGLSIGDGWTSVLTVLGFQGVLITAVTVFAIFRRSTGRPLPTAGVRPAAPLGDRLLLGAAVFCAAMPFIWSTSIASAAAMNLLDLEIKQQDLANLFATTDSPLLLLTLALMGIIVAPLGEELLFRAGIFRILGRYLPRWAALLGSALLFAALHQSLVHFIPLTVLGMIFALAYEKTGSLLVPVVAHGLFNLNSIVGLLAGLGSAS